MFLTRECWRRRELNAKSAGQMACSARGWTWHIETCMADAIYVLHAFEKKPQKATQHDLEIGRERFRAIGRLRQEPGRARRR